MFVKMLTTLGTEYGAFVAGTIYEVADAIGGSWVRAKHAVISTMPPEFVEQVLKRLDDGAGKPCLFLPFVGEFGHEIMSHTRIVHFHKASRKVVCCRPGNEVLYPSAHEFINDWVDPVPDSLRIATMRDRNIHWPELIARHPELHPVEAGGLTPSQEIFCINPDQRIPYQPQKRGLKVDVVLGVRRRDFAPERNWQHWQWLADQLSCHGYTFAVVGDRATSFGLHGQTVHAADFDTAAAVELLQNCRLYVGSDSGASHLAATVGAPMLLFRETSSGSRDLTPRMRQVNPDRVELVIGGWERAGLVAERMLDALAVGQVDDATLYTAQHGEDRWIAKHWAALRLPDVGTYVEVGAADGVTLSNTYWLAKAKRWNGLLIEPDPRSAAKLSLNRPESQIETVAAGEKSGIVTFGLMGEPTLSGLLRNGAEAVDVRVETLSHLLWRNQIATVDVLSIDTEGTELDVWAGLDLSRWRPRVVIIEWDTVGLPSTKEAIITRMELDGYIVAIELGGNLVFVPRTNTEFPRIEIPADPDKLHSALSRGKSRLLAGKPRPE